MLLSNVIDNTSTNYFVILNNWILIGLEATRQSSLPSFTQVFSVYFIIFWSYILLINLSSTIHQHGLIKGTKMLLVEAEQEISNLDDISKLAILVVALILASLSVYKLFFLLATYISKPIVSQTMLLAIYVLTPPTLVSVLCGKYILHYLKGSTFNSNTAAVAIFDVAALISFFFRFLLQLIRYILVVIKFTLLHSYFSHHYSYRPPVIVMRLHPTLEDAKPFYFFEECWELQQELVH